MNRRRFLHSLAMGSAAVLPGCGLLRLDPYHYLVRSDVIRSAEQEREIMSRASLSHTDDGRVGVLYVSGTPYERGYQHGKLLRQEIHDNIGYLYEQALSKFHFEELFAEVYERMRPYIPQEYVDEMHGLAHGSRMPLNVIHHVHVLPSIGEWSGKRRIKEVIKKMMKGEDLDLLATTCSNFSVGNTATSDRSMYTVRILDWGLHRISKLHQYPLITVGQPEDGGYAYANVGWMGFIGAVSGMNEQGITLGEMGYGSPPNETLYGKPMVFLLRDVLSQAGNLSDVRRIIQEAIGTNSFIFLMSDGKTRESEMYIKDRDRFLVFKPGEHAKDGEESLPAITDTIYGGHYDELMTAILKHTHGGIDLATIQQLLVPKMMMKHNFQNVIYDPVNLSLWVNNAKDKDTPAAGQPYSHFNLTKALQHFSKNTKVAANQF